MAAFLGQPFRFRRMERRFLPEKVVFEIACQQSELRSLTWMNVTQAKIKKDSESTSKRLPAGADFHIVACRKHFQRPTRMCVVLYRAIPSFVSPSVAATITS
jgi:hypothetical protein